MFVLSNVTTYFSFFAKESISFLFAGHQNKNKTITKQQKWKKQKNPQHAKIFSGF